VLLAWAVVVLTAVAGGAYFSWQPETLDADVDEVPEEILRVDEQHEAGPAQRPATPDPPEGGVWDTGPGCI